MYVFTSKTWVFGKKVQEKFRHARALRRKAKRKAEKEKRKAEKLQ